MIYFLLHGGGLRLLMLHAAGGASGACCCESSLKAIGDWFGDVSLIILLWKHLLPIGLWTGWRGGRALQNHWVSLEQALTLNAKRAMLNPTFSDLQTVIVFNSVAIPVPPHSNKWSLKRDADPEHQGLTKLRPARVTERTSPGGVLYCDSVRHKRYRLSESLNHIT